MPFLKMPGGGFAHIRVSRARRSKCCECKTRWGTRQCDGVAPKRRSKTCDRHLCDQCTTRVGEVDYCRRCAAPKPPPAVDPQGRLPGV